MNLLSRFADKIEFGEQFDDCWNWTASTNSNGYGQINIKGMMISAHRLTYELYKGKIPDDKELDHICENRICVNPLHIEAVTHKQNMSHVKKPKHYKKGK